MPLSYFPLPGVESSADAEQASIERVARSLTARTPKGLCNAIRDRVRYCPERNDYWQHTEETWIRKQGDCEDYAIAVHDLCRYFGIDTEIYVLHATGADMAHAIVVGRWNGKIWFSSNGSYQECDNVSDVYRAAAAEMQWRRDAMEVYTMRDGEHRDHERLGSLKRCVADS
jgi:transglutaminase-like putative cysteine protease